MKKTVTLNPGESKQVAFTFTPTIAKTYSVGVNGLTGSFIAVEVSAAELRVTDLVIAYPQLYVGQQQSISVIATNVGSVAGTWEIICEII